MTYCVGLLVDTGLVMLSDSRTNAGVDQINTFRKMATFQRANDRVLVILSAGNLAITPYAALQNQIMFLPAYTEYASAGSSQFALNYGNHTFNATRTGFSGFVNVSSGGVF